MIKIMIVDDESLFRQFLRSSIDWSTYGFEIVAEARNGAEALELAEETEPAIVLVDINMPHMDGVTFTEHLKKRSPDVSVVLITGHSEFEYARKALKLGVDDYILKPFDKEELILTLLRIRDERARHSTERQGSEPQTGSDLALLRESYLHYLLSDEYNDQGDEMERELEAAQLTINEAASYRTVCIEIDNMERKWERVKDRQLWRFAVSNILREVLEGHDSIIFNGPEGRIVCFLPIGSRSVEMDYLEGLERLCFLIPKFLKFTITVGVGRIHQGVSGIRLSYREGLKALRSKFVLGNNRVILFNPNVEEEGHIGGGIPDISEQFTMLLRMNDADALMQEIDKVFQRVREQHFSIEHTYVLCMGIVARIMSYVSSLGKPVSEVFGEHFYPYSEIRTKETIEDAQAWIKELVHATVKYAASLNPSRSGSLAGGAKDYIDENFHDPDMNVDQIAKHLYIHSSHLRAVFKKETGTTLTDYVFKVRMHHAKELIVVGNIKLSEIARQVGFNDAGYFSKCFKKHYGVSPSEYEQLAKST